MADGESMSVGGDRLSIMSREDGMVKVSCALVVVVLCLLTAGCGIISIGVSNSPDWCPNPRNPVSCPQ